MSPTFVSASRRARFVALAALALLATSVATADELVVTLTGTLGVPFGVSPGVTNMIAKDGSVVLSFDIPSDPATLAAGIGANTVVANTNLTYTLNGSPVEYSEIYGTTPSIDFSNASLGGGFYAQGEDVSSGLTGILAISGAQLYSGPETAPTFTPGTYSVNVASSSFVGEYPLGGGNGEGDYLTAGTITIEPLTSTTPEPSSWVLLLTGAAGLAGLARRKALRTLSR